MAASGRLRRQGPAFGLVSVYIACICIGTAYAATYKELKSFTAYGEHTFTVPDGVHELKIEAWGAGGGGFSDPNRPAYSGGSGGYSVDPVVPVSPGDVLTVRVGQGGAACTYLRESGAGGGGTGVRRADNSIILIAGGGGGGAYYGRGGHGGGTSGEKGQSSVGHPAEGGFPGTQSGPGAGGHGDRRHGKSGSGGNGGFYASVFPISGLTDNNNDKCPDHLPTSFGDGTGGCGHSFPADTGHGGGGGGYFGGGTGGGTGASSGGGGGSGWVDSDGSMVTGGASNAGAGQPGNHGKVIIYSRIFSCFVGTYGDPAVGCEKCPAGTYGIEVPYQKWAEVKPSATGNCPSPWQYTTASSGGTTYGICRRGCDTCCSEATFRAPDNFYDLKGYIKGMQYYSMDGFQKSQDINGRYLDGIAVTTDRGAGREHVWSYGVGISDTEHHGSYNCPCHLGPSVPSFVGSHYYCESGNSGPSWQARWYAEDILWDGSDCPHSDNHCCSSAAEPEEGMPWFRRSFDDATIAITVGLCSDQDRGNEDVGLVEMEMWAKVGGALSQEQLCESCAAGKYGTVEGSKSAADCVSCPAGHYCEARSAAPTPCPAGKFSAATSRTSAGDCSGVCPGGYYCPQGSTTGTAHACPDGYYSSSGAVDSRCDGECEAGYFCAPPATSARGAQCGAGNYCPAKSVAPLEIEVGYYGVGGTSTTRTGQVVCPKGYYCSGGVKSICPAGSYGGAEGLSSTLRAETCQGLHDAGVRTSGVFTVYPGGSPVLVYCSFSSSSPYDSRGWTRVASEPVGSATGLYFLSQTGGTQEAISTGGAGNVGPLFTGLYDQVLLVWGASNDRWIRFKVNVDFFAKELNLNIPVTDFATNDASLQSWVSAAGGAHLCKASLEGGAKPGDTGWAIKANSDNNVGCGCNSGGWTGSGAYYGGYPSGCSVCGCQGGGWAGTKSNGQPKGGVTDQGIKIYVGSSSTDVVVSACSGPCRAGFYCPAGSTTDTQEKCADGTVPAATQYCPAGTPVRKTVSPSYYTTPESGSLETRSGQEPCTASYVCKNGLRVIGLDWTDQAVRDTCGTSGASTVSVAEREAGAAVSSFRASTPGSGDSITYTMAAVAKGESTCADDAPFEFGTDGGLSLKSGVVLDHETCSHYTLTVTAAVSESSQLTCSVRVNINDGNDPPEFPSSTYTFSVVEGAAEGADVGTPVTADDPDVADELSYSITAGNGKGFFSIGACSGQLRLDKGGIDFETDPSFTLTVSVTDGSVAATATVTVDVVNVNDPPVFGQTTYSLSIEENKPDGAEVGTVAAVDTDGDDLEYSLKHNNDRVFSIERATGVLRLARPAGILSNPVFAQVPDRNVDWYDNQPGITMTHSFAAGGSYTVSTSKSDGRPGLIHYQVDVDGCVSYTLAVNGVALAGSARFYIHGSGGELLWPGPELPTGSAATVEHEFVVPCSVHWIRVGVLMHNPTAGDYFRLHSVVLSATSAYVPLASSSVMNFEVKNQYSVTVAVDDGHGGEAQVPVEVRVVNANDPPTFAPPTLTVSEDAAIGAQVGGLLQAKDEDAGTTLTWALLSHTSTFALSTDGQLTLKAALDYVVAPSYDLVVKVTDNGTPADRATTASVTETVTVNVINSNDPPSIAAQTRAVAENMAPNTLVGDPLAASDPDNGSVPGSVQDLLFYIVGGDSDLFGVEPSTGQLYTRAALDYETAPGNQHTLQVKVRDSGSPTPNMDSEVVTVTVTITDVNEAPTFVPQYRSVPENSPSTTVVGDPLVCSDVDAGDAANLRFAITANAKYGSAESPKDTFTIDAVTGQLTVAGWVDIEATWPPLDLESIPRLQVTVSCDDQRGGVTESEVYIDITNVNEAPEVPPFQFRYLAELTVGPRAFGQVVVATDVDAADEGGVTLAIVAGSEAPAACSGLFSISTGGQLTLEGTAPAYGSPNCTLSVVATDTSGLESAPETVTVQFTDTNNYPQMSGQSVSIAEDTAPGTVVVADMGATDLDGDSLSFTITAVVSHAPDPEGGADLVRDVTASGVFTVDRTTSALSLSESARLDFELVTQYVVTVEVEDDGAGRLQSFADVAVTVLDVNEAPVLQVPASVTPLAETAASGAVVVTATATDVDAGDTITFGLAPLPAGSPLPFAIDTNTGVVTRTGALDYETAASYSMRISATDTGGLATSADVTVRVDNVNEAATVTVPSVIVSEDAVIGTSLGTVTVSDPDGAAGTVAFAVTGGSGEGVFAISASTGVITLAAALDYETTASYELEVTVTESIDRDVASIAHTKTVAITVTNVNDLRVDSVTVPAGAQYTTKTLSTAGEQIVVIRGANFGAWDSTIVAKYGPAASPTKYTATACSVSEHNVAIECRTAAGVGGAVPLQWTVTSGTDTVGPTALAATGVAYAPPTITGASAAAVPTSGGTTGDAVVTITGTNFGPAGTTVDSAVYGRSALYSATPLCSVVGHTSMKCGTVPGAGVGHQWRVGVGGQVSQWSDASVTTDYKAPAISDIAAGAGVALDGLLTSGNEAIIITGVNLGPGSRASATVAQNALAAVTASYGSSDGDVPLYFSTTCTVTIPHVQVTCMSAVGIGAGLRWFLTVGGQGSGESDASVSYARPAITSVGGKGAIGATTRGGEVVLIAGSNFGAASNGGFAIGGGASSTAQATYGPTGAEYTATGCTVSEAHSQLQCLTAEGTGAGHKWKVSIGGQWSDVVLPLMLDGTRGTRYAAPIVSYFEGEGKSSTTEGGEQVLVHGHNFGTDASLVTGVSYSQTDVPDVVFTTSCTIAVPHETLACSTVAGAGTDLEWRLHVDGQRSTNALTKYNTPVIIVVGLASSVLPAHPDGGEEVIVTGTDFGPPPTSEDDPVFVTPTAITYGPTGVEYTCADPRHISHRELRCTTVPGFGTDLRFRVVIGTQESAVTGTGVGLSYRAPVIESLDPPSAGANDKAVVTITANNLPLLDSSAVVVVLFGNTQDGSRAPQPRQLVSRYPSAGADNEGYTPRVTEQQVTFKVPLGVGLARGVTLAVYRSGKGLASAIKSTPVAFDFTPPKLDYVFVNRTAEFVELQVFGTNFGDELADQVRRSVLVQVYTPSGDVDASVNGGEFSTEGVTVSSWQNDVVVVRTSTAFGRLKVRVRSLPFDAPAPADSAADGDWDVQDTREFYFADASPTISNREAQIATDFSTEGYVEALAVGEERSRRVLSVMATNLEGVSQLFVNVSGHSCELLFDLATWEPAYYDNPDNLITSGTEWRIECAMPPGQGTQQPVIIEKNDGQRSAAFTVDYAAPVVATITSSSTGSAVIAGTQRITAPTGGYTMTMTGTNFGVRPQVIVGPHTVYSVGDPAAPAGNTNWFTEFSHRSLTFVVPDGVGRDLSVGMMPPDAGYTLPGYPFDYEPPSIAGIVYATSPTRGGVALEINGANFGPISASNTPTVTIGGRPCTGATVAVAHTRITCTTPAGQGREQPVVVTVGHQSATLSGAAAYTYQPPRVDELVLPGAAESRRRVLVGPASYTGSAMRGPTHGGFNVTVTGSDFGERGDSCVFVTSLVALQAAMDAHSAPLQPHDGGPLTCNGGSDFNGEGELPASLIHVHSHDTIVFEVPAGMGRKVISVMIKGQSSMETVLLEPNFVYHDPEVTEVSPQNGPTVGGTVITVTGENLGFPASKHHQQYMQVDFHAGCLSNATTPDGTVPTAVQRCSRGTVLYHDHNTIRIRLPGGIGVNRAVGVALWDGEVRAESPKGTPETLFSYDPPRVDVVFPNPPHFESEPLQLELRGVNFGRFADSDAWTQAEREVTVLIQGEACDNAQRVPGEDSSLSCSMAPQTVGHKNVSIMVAGQAGHVDELDDRAVYAVCAKGYYGRDGERCLPCPRGAECDGFINQVHSEPRALPGWFNLNVTQEQCSPERATTRTTCNMVVPCEPKDACTGNNLCAEGYKSVAPIMRCAQCDDCYRATPDAECQRYYRRAGECVKCPDAPLLLIIGFVIAALGMCVVGYILNRKAVNLAFFSIGVDYFQVLAMFANSRIQWPTMIVEMFHMLSVFNLNLEITAPECSIPDIGYKTKWFFVQALPLGAALLFLLMHVSLVIKKRCFQCRKKKLNSHASALIAMFLVSFYFLFLYLSKTTLDVFNCAPTDPPDGKEYLEVVFEPCWEAGGIQMTLLPFAIITLFAYSFGYPAICALILTKYKFLIMEDQLLRAQNMGRTRLDNPHAYDIRKRFHRVYYHFRPERHYWVLVILGRKFLIAFTSLMFNKNPAFQLSVALLVMFAAYALQVKHRPYMSPSEGDAVTAHHMRMVAEGDQLHMRLETELTRVRMRLKRNTTNRGWNAVKKKQQTVGETALSFFWNYNTVEMTLLASAVLVNLAGVMFESNRFQSDYYSTQRDGVTVFTLLVIFASISYFAVVLVSEIFVSVWGDKVSCAVGAKRKAKGKSRKGSLDASTRSLGADAPIDMTNNAAFTGSGVNPLFNSGAGAGAGAGGEAAIEMTPRSSMVAAQLQAGEARELEQLRREVLQLKAENRTLRGVLETLPGTGHAKAPSSPTKRQFKPQQSGAGVMAMQRAVRRNRRRGRNAPDAPPTRRRAAPGAAASPTPPPKRSPSNETDEGYHGDA